MKRFFAAIALSALAGVSGGGAQAAGFSHHELPDGTQLGVWYPSQTPPAEQINTPFRQAVALDAAPDGQGLPLLVVSHGYGSWMGGHASLALALAEAGVVVAVPTHRGSSARDMTQPPSVWMRRRPQTLSFVIDFALHEWRHADQLDPDRIAAFGYSAGGHAVLSALGARPDLARLDHSCALRPETPACREAPQGLRATGVEGWPSDPRLNAAVLAAPALAETFSADSLAQLSQPLQIWAGAADALVPLATTVRPLMADLPDGAQMRLVPEGRHSAFLEPCPPGLKGQLPPNLWEMLCTDPEGFDRRAFQQEMARAIAGFLHAALPR